MFFCVHITIMGQILCAFSHRHKIYQNLFFNSITLSYWRCPHRSSVLPLDSFRPTRPVGFNSFLLGWNSFCAYEMWQSLFTFHPKMCSIKFAQQTLDITMLASSWLPSEIADTSNNLQKPKVSAKWFNPYRSHGPAVASLLAILWQSILFAFNSHFEEPNWKLWWASEEAIKNKKSFVILQTMFNFYSRGFCVVRQLWLCWLVHFCASLHSLGFLQRAQLINSYSFRCWWALRFVLHGRNICEYGIKVTMSTEVYFLSS